MKPRISLTATNQITMIFDPENPDVYIQGREEDVAMTPDEAAKMAADIVHALMKLNGSSYRESMLDVLNAAEVYIIETDFAEQKTLDMGEVK